MLPLTKRPEFKRRYSAGCRIIFASCFAHDDVLEFFLKAAERAHAARIAEAKYCAQPGMAERSQWSNVGALSYSRRDACRLPGSRVGGASICFDDLGAPGGNRRGLHSQSSDVAAARRLRRHR